MKKFRNSILKFPRTFFKSIFDLPYYRVLNQRPIGKGILYLAVISLLSGFLSMVPFIANTQSDIALLTGIFTDKTPDFTIRDGILTVDGEGPLTIHEEPGKALVIVMDPEDETSLDSYFDFQTAVVMFSDRLHVRYAGLERDFHYATYLTEAVNKEDLVNLFPLLQISILLFSFFFVGYILMTRFLAALVAALAARVASLLSRKPQMNLLRLFNLACYASTLPSILATILYVFSIQLQFADLIYILIIMLYVWWAVQRIHSAEPKDSPESYVN